MATRDRRRYDAAVQLIVRSPSAAFERAISTHPERERIDPRRALAQHRDFCAALRRAGLTLVELPPEPDLPDAPFVSDVLVALPHARTPDAQTALLVATRPGEPARRPEVSSVVECARRLVRPGTPESRILEPGTLDAGDVLVFGDRLAIGVSARTNRCGAAQLAVAAAALGYRVALCPVTDRLHLATAVTAVGTARLIGTPAGFASLDAAEPVAGPSSTAAEWLADVRRIVVRAEDLPAANVLAAGGTCFMVAGHPEAAAALRRAGERVLELELDEFVRADGGPTCLVAPVP